MLELNTIEIASIINKNRKLALRNTFPDHEQLKCNYLDIASTTITFNFVQKINLSAQIKI